MSQTRRAAVLPIAMASLTALLAVAPHAAFATSTPATQPAPADARSGEVRLESYGVTLDRLPAGWMRSRERGQAFALSAVRLSGGRPIYTTTLEMLFFKEPGPGAADFAETGTKSFESVSRQLGLIIDEAGTTLAGRPDAMRMRLPADQIAAAEPGKYLEVRGLMVGQRLYLLSLVRVGTPGTDDPAPDALMDEWAQRIRFVDLKSPDESLRFRGTPTAFAEDDKLIFDLPDPFRPARSDDSTRLRFTAVDYREPRTRATLTIRATAPTVSAEDLRATIDEQLLNRGLPQGSANWQLVPPADDGRRRAAQPVPVWITDALPASPDEPTKKIQFAVVSGPSGACRLVALDFDPAPDVDDAKNHWPDALRRAMQTIRVSESYYQGRDAARR